MARSRAHGVAQKAPPAGKQPQKRVSGKKTLPGGAQKTGTRTAKKTKTKGRAVGGEKKRRFKSGSKLISRKINMTELI
jgi:hypothetical protein